ncbi:hypothetical protein D3C86_2238940 [compost metagenome]
MPAIVRIEKTLQVYPDVIIRVHMNAFRERPLKNFFGECGARSRTDEIMQNERTVMHMEVPGHR